MAILLNDKVVRALPSPDKGNRITYDIGVAGFGVRTTAAGAKSFVLNYRAGGRERRFTIGSFPDWTTKQAREEAKSLKRRIDTGEDRMGRREAERSAPTVNDLGDRFEAEHLPRLRPASAREYRSLIQTFIGPYLGQLRVEALRYADIETLHRKIVRTAPYRANRTFAVLSKMLSLAIKWEIRTDNPAKGIERTPEEKRERYLSPAEIARLADVLATHPERTSAYAVRVLLLTGARRGETLNSRWQDFDLAAGGWTKPAATTKTAKLHRVPLSAPALALLTERKAEADRENARRVRDGLPPIEHAFPSLNGKPLRELKHFWSSVRSKAGLPSVRLHDLRHTYASILASSGPSLPIIGQLLGHTQTATTARYAHLLDDPLRKATETAAAIIAGVGKEGATVPPLAGGRLHD
jgi:integrase